MPARKNTDRSVKSGPARAAESPQSSGGPGDLQGRIDELKATLPPKQDWRSTDEQEINRRRVRALENPPTVRTLETDDKIHGVYEVVSAESGRVYQVEILDLAAGVFYSTSPDFATSGLGTCKHTEAVLFHLRRRFPRLYRRAGAAGPAGEAVVVRDDDLELHGFGGATVPRRLRLCLDRRGRRKSSCPPGKLAAAAGEAEGVRVSRQVGDWIESRRRAAERVELRREYEMKVRSGEFPAHETKLPLFPYQREGMLHLAFTERALIADEMGLGKTIQGIAAAALLRRMGKARRCLVVAPTSLKAEWEEQIAKFTDLECRLVYGGRGKRCATYREPAGFFTVVNYEQVRSDALDINAALRPDIVILDEAQRIKNWSSQTARAIKRLESRYAFVLTGTPIENRIDELYSIVEFLDPTIFGALFRFNREYHQLDDRGKPEGYRNLDRLRQKVAPILLRRRKSDVETELPDRSDENRFVELTEGQQSDYASCQDAVRRLIHRSRKRPLRFEEHQRLMGYLGQMRMLCDTQYILDGEIRVSPKLDELAAIFDEALADADTKIIVFSEWVRMLELIRDHLRARGTGFAWHTGKVPQTKRRAEINAFKQDPDCRVFLCTESGGSGLNLQNASLVINVDLPWNPAKLEQRIARAWRKGQRRPVQVINLVARGTIEHGMLETLALKQGLADGVLDGAGNLSEIKLKRGGQTFLTRLEQTLEVGKHHAVPKTTAPAVPADPARGLVEKTREAIGDRLLHGEEHFLDEQGASAVYLVVDAVDPTLEQAVNRAALACYPEAAERPEWLEEKIVLVDVESHRAFERLRRAGLVRSEARARRDLLDPAASGDAKPSLTPEQRARIAALAEKRDEQLKAAEALLAAGLAKLAAAHGREACLAAAGIASVRQGLTPPKTFDETRTEPHLGRLDDALRACATDFAEPDPEAETLKSRLDALRRQSA
jgi:superfamily II DNA or RNA helicase